MDQCSYSITALCNEPYTVVADSTGELMQRVCVCVMRKEHYVLMNGVLRSSFEGKCDSVDRASFNLHWQCRLNCTNAFVQKRPSCTRYKLQHNER